MFEQLNIESKVPIYEQIEVLVQAAIASGQVKAGEKLPAARQLAESLDLNTNTVARAYRDLELMGFVTSRQGAGVFVRSGIEDECIERIYRRIVIKLHESVGEAKAAGLGLSELDAIVKKCYASNAAPYAPVPEDVY